VRFERCVGVTEDNVGGGGGEGDKECNGVVIETMPKRRNKPRIKNGRERRKNEGEATGVVGFEGDTSGIDW
jgi:hypothetical protein